MSTDPTLSNADRSDVDRELTDRESAAHQTTQRDPQSAGEMDHPSGVLRVRCPHCHSPLVLPGEDAISPIDCVACGGRFSLLSGEETLAAGPKAGRALGDFELLELLGAGQFGKVWKARDRRLDRIVAVKIPRKSHLSAAETEQFLREARAAAQVQHPNIVAVHEVGMANDAVYIVSDFVSGVTLTSWLAIRRLTPVEAARLCVKMADALHAAHKAGVIHRDLKPSNILLDTEDQPHITDFGLARREAGDVTMTSDGMVLGTPAYMSPEQARGEGHRADRRSDIYSLGVILYELLTGERPFRGDSRMLVYQVLRDEPPAPRRLNSRIPRDLEVICLKCLEKSPERRYATASELAADLERFLDGKAISAAPVGTVGRVWRWYRRHPDATVLAAGGYGTLCSTLLLLWGVSGIVVYALGLHPTASRLGAIRDIVILIACFYFPMLCAGIRALNFRLDGLWVGGFLSVLGTLLSLAGMFGVAFDAGTFGDLAVRMPLFILLTCMSSVGAALHAVAIVSQATKTTGRQG